MSIKIGYAEGTCSNCGKTIRRRRPANYAVCDCFEYCPLCGKKMAPYVPDLTPLTYGPLEIEGASGDLESPINILYFCADCKYYSTMLPVEVKLE